MLSVWPYIGDEPNQIPWKRASLAMAVRSRNAHDALQTIQARHWEALAQKHGGAPTWEAMCALAERAEPTLQDLACELPSGFPMRSFEAIAAGMRGQLQRFRMGVDGADEPHAHPRMHK